MRIIDNERRKDYYDGVAKSLGDHSITYVRTYSKIPFKSPVVLPRDYFGEYNFGTALIGFCGEIIPLAFSTTHGSANSECGFFYSFEAYEKYREDKKIKTKDYWWANKFKDFFVNNSRTTDSLTKIFDYGKLPVFILERDYLIKNPLLKYVSFWTKYEPYAAFQKLQQYIGNVAEDRKVIPKISDELKAESHGFNKFSFRKPKFGE